MGRNLATMQTTREIILRGVMELFLIFLTIKIKVMAAKKIKIDNASFKFKKQTQRREQKVIRCSVLIVCEGTKTEPNYFDAFAQKQQGIIAVSYTHLCGTYSAWEIRSHTEISPSEQYRCRVQDVSLDDTIYRSQRISVAVIHSD